jgi:hypothetical protein
VAARFDALLRYAGLRLGRQLGTEVTPALSRKELTDPSLRAHALVSSLGTSGTLEGAIRIPGTVGPLVVTADLRAGKVTCHVEVDAPREGRSATRVNWLLRQLRNAPETVRVEAFTVHTRGAGAAELLRDVRANPAVLITDPKKELRAYRIALTTTIGTKRGRGRGSFIDSVLDAIDSFYADVVQQLKAWTAAPPRLREVAAEQQVRPALSSTALSSQDGTEEATPPERTVAAGEPAMTVQPG